MNEFQWDGQVMGGRRPPRLAGFTPAAALIFGLMRRGGVGRASPDLIDRHLDRVRGQAQSGAQAHLQDFASGR